MRKFSLVNLLKWKVIWVLVAFAGGMICYFHLLSLQGENEQNIRRIEQIADFLSSKAPPKVFAALEPAPTDNALGRAKLQPQLQALLEELCLPLDFIRYGYYSKRSGNIVAFGPQYDPLMLSEVDPARFHTIHESTTDRILEEDSSIIWYGSRAITCIRPIVCDGEIVGHAFASVNRDYIADLVKKRTLGTCLGALIMLMGCIMIYCELFRRFRKDMQAYAESLVKGENHQYEVLLPELKPFLDYINQQMDHMTYLDRLNTLGEMGAGIAHEVRNPLTTVRGQVQLLHKKASLEEFYPKFDIMLNEIDAANVIISDLIAFSKDKALHFTAIDLNQLIRKFAPTLEAMGETMAPAARLALDLQEAPKISVDIGNIRQLLRNLVKNAFEAMPEGGTVTIRTASTGAGLLLSVQDEGCGIPESLIAKIGTPFFTTKNTGNGLGVAICNRIALWHQATVQIKPNPEKGVTFTFLFPYNQQPESAEGKSS